MNSWFATIIIWCAFCSVVKSFHLNSNAVINHVSVFAITSVNTSTLQKYNQLTSLVTYSKQVNSWLHFDINQLDFNFDSNEFTNEISVKSKYLRFTSKYSSMKTKLILIFTENFEEIVTAVQRSSYGTDSNSIFIILHSVSIEHTNNLQHQFSTLLIYNEEIEYPFNAVLVFLKISDHKNNVGILCYLCPASKIKNFYLQSFNTDILKLLNDKLNKHGHGHKLFVPVSLGCDMELQSCLKTEPFDQVYKLNMNRKLLYRYLVNCNSCPYMLYQPILSYMNFTWTLYGDQVSEKNKLEARWGLKLAYGEAWFLSVPNKYLETRGIFVIPFSKNLNIVACLKSTELQNFELSILTIIRPNVWLCIILTMLVHYLLNQRLSRSTNFVAYIFGFLSESKNSSTKLLGYSFVGVYLITLVWQSSMSADIIGIKNFPKTAELVSKKFRVWTTKIDFDMLTAYLKKHNASLIPGEIGKNFVYDSSKYPFPVNKSKDVIQKMVTKKLAVANTDLNVFDMSVWKKANFVGRTTICKSNLANPNLKRLIDYSVRIWGSDYGSDIFKRWIENGFVSRGFDVSMQGQTFLVGLPLTPVEGFSYPTPLGLDSVLGVLAWGLLGSFGLALVIWLLQWLLAKPCKSRKFATTPTVVENSKAKSFRAFNVSKFNNRVASIFYRLKNKRICK